jgi:hypothetical protein
MTWVAVWTVLLIAATWFDWATTKRVFELGGWEKNPVAKWLFKRLGIPGKLIFDLILVLASSYSLCYLISWKAAVIYMTILTLIQFFVGIQNKDVIERLEIKGHD